VTAFLAGAAAPLVAQSSFQYVPVISNYAGLATTVCANATDSMGDGCPATQAKFGGVVGAVTDGAGNLYISDATNNVIRRIDARTQVITLVAGGATTVCAAATNSVGDGCPATQATINGPRGIRFDPFGNLIIADSNIHRIRSVNAQSGIITTIAGNGVAGTAVPSNTSPKPSNQTPLSFPYDTAFDAQGNMYIVNYKGASFVSVVAAINGAIDPDHSLAYNLAGTGVNGVQGVPGVGTAGQVSGPHGLTIDAAGNLYAANYSDNTVRMITSPLVGGKLDVTASRMTLIAGQSGKAAGAGAAVGDGGPATGALLAGVQGVQIGPAGELYALQATGSVDRISRIDANGVINTYAGLSGTRDTTGLVGANGPALTAQLGGPSWGTFDAFGHFYVTAQYSINVYSISPNNRFPITALGAASASQNVAAQANQALTLASVATLPATSEFAIGALSGCSAGGAMAASAYCTLPVTFHPTLPGLRTAQLTMTDSKSNVSILGLSGVGVAPAVSFGGATLSTIAGTGTAGNANPTGAAILAQLNAPRGGAFDAAGNLYFADSANHQIRRIDHSTGAISKVAGTGTAGFAGDSAAATLAQLNTPKNVVLDAAGNLYIADSGNHCIRFVDAGTGIITTLAGTGTAGYTGDGGLATAATLNDPQGLAVDGLGDVYVADAGNNVIRKFYPHGPITTFAGTGVAGFAGDSGPAAYAQLDTPSAIALDLVGNLFVADTGNSVVRKISTLGQISTYAGRAGVSQNGGDGGPATAASLQSPSSIALDPAGDLMIASGGEVRMVDSFGVMTTIAGTDATGPYSGEGGPATSAVIPAPVANIALDASSNLYIFAAAANRVLEVTSATAPILTFNQPKASTSSAPQSITIQNSGNSSLTLSNLSASTGFTLQSSGSNTCVANTVLAQGQSCVLSIVFSSSTSGVFHGTVTLSDDALNSTGSTQTIPLTGVAGAITSTTTALTVSASTAPYGTSVVLTATVTGQSTPTGTVQFTANGKVLGEGTLANGIATLTLNSPGVGSYPILAAYQGDSDNTSSISNGPVSLLITRASLTVTATNATRQGGDVNPAFTYTVTGFLNGESASVLAGTPLETTTAVQTSPVGSYSIVITQGTLNAANYQFTFVNGTLTVTTPVPDFAVSASIASLTVASGQSAATTITVSPLHTFSGTVTLKCSNVPVNVVCTFNTNQLTADSTGTPQSTQLTIGTNALSQIAGLERTTRPPVERVLFSVAFPFLALAALLSGKRKKAMLTALLSSAALFLLPVLATGCTVSEKALAAPGKYNITVTAADSAHNISRDIGITFTIN
jgi:sugar lactone lactonase YvrE